MSRAPGQTSPRNEISTSSYGVDRGRHLASSTFAGVAQCRALSPDFPAGARGLYPLARGCRIRPARGMAPALMGCWIEAGAGFFLFSVLPGGAVELPGRSRPAPGGVDLRWGPSQCRALSPDFPAGARGLYPLARGCRIRPARGMAPALMGCWIEGGASFFLFSVLPGAAVELPGRSRPAPGIARWGTLNVELSLPIFRLALAVFIPWRGADGFDRRAGWHPR